MALELIEMRFKILLLVLLSTFAMADKITLALAGNVAYAIDDLKKEFHKLYPNIEVQIILGGTGKLTAQIMHKAPYDILMGANMMYPETLYQKGFAVTRPLVYAKGSLALVSRTKRDFSKGLELIKEANIKKIAIANPKTAPYGVATFEALKNAKLLEALKPKFVYAESISQTVIYTTKVTDIGFIAKSALFSSKMAHLKEGRNWIAIDTKLYAPIEQGIVILKHGAKNAEVSAFYAFIFSREAQKIFEKFGYLVGHKRD